MVDSETIYKKLLLVPKGKVTTYKCLAIACGTKAFRLVGQILSKNPYAPIVPCHRVVKSDGKVGGFCGEIEGEKVNEKAKLLSDEGVEIKDGKVVDYENKLFDF